MIKVTARVCSILIGASILSACITPGGFLHRMKEPPLYRFLPEKLKPRADLFHMYPKDAPKLVQKAWFDGCKTGVYVMGGTTWRRFHRFSQDAAMRKDPNYYRTWKDAYTFCRHYSYGVSRASDARSTLVTKAGSNTNEYGLGGLIEPGHFFKKSMFKLDGPEGSAFFKSLKLPINTNSWSLEPTSGEHMKIATNAVAHVLDFKNSNYINNGSAFGGLTMDWTDF